MIYFILAAAAGVFYREFTKFNGYTGETALSYVHTHLFVLGMFAFLVIALLDVRSRNYLNRVHLRNFLFFIIFPCRLWQLCFL